MINVRFFATIAFTFLAGSANASKSIPVPLEKQVCASQAVMVGEVIEVEPENFSIHRSISGKKYANHYAVAGVKVKETLRGSLDSADGKVSMYFLTRFENNPYDSDRALYSPKVGHKGIWLVMGREPFNGFYGNGNPIGPLDLGKKAEVEKYLKACPAATPGKN
jgi:hypothetical protein